MILSNPLTHLVNSVTDSAMCQVTRTITPRHYNPILYTGFETGRRWRQCVSDWTNLGLDLQITALRCLGALGNPFAARGASWLGALSVMNERWSREYGKPSFDITSVMTAGGEVAVKERVSHRLPFGSLVRFQRETQRRDPKLLIVAPMSGHYATLLRDTVATLLADHDVYITDWHNAREVPTSYGTFGFEDYVSYIMEFLEYLGPETHLLAVCQPTVATLVATACLEAQDHPCRPASLTLMGGPIDTAAAPTEVTKFADNHPLEWFERKLIAKVPHGYPGAGRLVYPGFLQLGGFIAMNPEKHLKSHVDLFRNLVKAEHALSEKTIKFYDEYLAVCDLPARFYLETIDRVFLRRDLANGTMLFKGKPVDPKAITRVPIFTVEGENDDISAPGQTIAAHRICSGLPRELHFNYTQAGAGHYGVFSGSKWRTQIAPRITSFIRSFTPTPVDTPSVQIDVPRWRGECF